jgi:biopolymer transport protein ExbD
MNLGSRNKIKVEGGMASMTDLVFLLLIFFIIMSLMSNQQTPVDLPKTDQDIKPVQDPITATVVITEENKYYALPGGTENDAVDDINLLTEKLMDDIIKSGKMKLKIAGHRKASYEAIFQALALAQANGWEPALAYDK